MPTDDCMAYGDAMIKVSRPKCTNTDKPWVTFSVFEC